MKQKIISFFLSPLIFLVIISTLIAGLIGSIVAVLSGGEEEENKQGTTVYEQSPLSPAVEALRDDILKELKNMEKRNISICFLP